MLARKTSLLLIAPSVLIALAPQACATGVEIDQETYQAVVQLGSDPVGTATVGGTGTTIPTSTIPTAAVS